MCNIYNIEDGSRLYDEQDYVKLSSERLEELREDAYLNPELVLESMCADAWPNEYEQITEDLGLYLKTYADLTKNKNVDIVALSRMLSKLPKEI